MSFSSAERARLAALLLKVGPDAPTLCEGWTARDLAAHLWVRENRPTAALGMFVDKLAPKLEREMAAATARDFEDVVREWGRGPANMFGRLLDDKVNAAEHYIHLEDVRRANGEESPREFSAAIHADMARKVALLGPRILRKSNAPVVLFPEGFTRVMAADRRGVAADGSDVVRVMGTAPELLLWLYGRDTARVTIEGPADKAVRSSI